MIKIIVVKAFLLFLEINNIKRAPMTIIKGSLIGVIMLNINLAIELEFYCH